VVGTIVGATWVFVVVVVGRGIYIFEIVLKLSGSCLCRRKM
jgi:hypothetical protein